MANLDEKQLLGLMMSSGDNSGIDSLDNILKQENLERQEEANKQLKREEKLTDQKKEVNNQPKKATVIDGVDLVKNRIKLLKENFKTELKDFHMNELDKFTTLEEY